MRKTPLFLALFFFCIHCLSMGQTKTINILCTSNFQQEDLDNLKELRLKLIGKKNQRNDQYKIKVQYIFNGSTINIYNSNDINLLNSKFTNLKFETIEDLKNHFGKISASQRFLEFQQNINFPSYSNSFISSVEQLAKQIKKESKKSNVNVIWNNGFEPYIYSSENILNIINNKSKRSDLNSVKPRIIKPSENEFLRPVSSKYILEFDSVGYFPSYQLIIYWKRPIGKNYLDKTIYDSVEILNECLSFNIETEVAKLYSYIDSRCRIDIKLEKLAMKCLQITPNYSTNTGISDLDEGCGDCKYACLFKKQFSLYLKGCAPGVNGAIVPLSIVQNFLFQCNQNSDE